MKVKVSYTVEKEEIPNIINTLSRQTLDCVRELESLACVLPASKDYGVCSLDKISKIKEISNSIHEYSTEMEAILSGFLLGFAPKQEQEVLDEQQQEAYNEALDQIRQMGEKIKEEQS